MAGLWRKITTPHRLGFLFKGFSAYVNAGLGPTRIP
jgi:hypothetical protein